ncbi:MAG TPA: ATP-binding protein [Vicinamibacterales bacterium]|nr:ATP-binding protein [Vicinamibacterales bacterium]
MILIVLVCATTSLPARIFAAESQKKVLVVYSYSRNSSAAERTDEAHRTVLNEGLKDRLDYYTEYLDVARFGDAKYQFALREYFRARYTDVRFNVVIAASGTVLDFVIRNRDIFGDAPIVFNADETVARVPNSTGVAAKMKLGETIAIAMRLQPGLKHVFVVNGSSESDKYFEDLARADCQASAGRPACDYLSGLTLDELELRVQHLPPDSMVFFVSLLQDAEGNRRSVLEALDRLTAVANVPVYSWLEESLGRGVVGGSLRSFPREAGWTAAVALRVLHGERADDIPITYVNAFVPEVDWRQLRRWSLAEARLPEGTLVLFRDQPPWERYRRFIIGTVVLVVVQACLIAGLLVQRRRRRRAEQILTGKEADLRTSYERIRDLAGRLINAQESERTRIARELHDDACQEVATVALRLHSVLDNRETVDPAARSALSSVHTRLAGIAESLRLLSHHLHPSVLQHIGLVAALEAHCAEAERHYDVQVRFIVEGDVEPVAPTVALSLFRIAQEALQNAARHGRARHATVALVRCNDDITLSVADDGVGFDVADARRNRGLGLVSMEERARLVKGHFTVHSQPQQGTTIAIRVTVDAVDDSQKEQESPRPVDDPELHVSEEYASSHRDAR